MNPFCFTWLVCFIHSSRSDIERMRNILRCHIIVKCVHPVICCHIDLPSVWPNTPSKSNDPSVHTVDIRDPESCVGSISHTSFLLYYTMTPVN